VRITQQFSHFSSCSFERSVTTNLFHYSNIDDGSSQAFSLRLIMDGGW